MSTETHSYSIGFDSGLVADPRWYVFVNHLHSNGEQSGETEGPYTEPEARAAIAAFQAEEAGPIIEIGDMREARVDQTPLQEEIWGLLEDEGIPERALQTIDGYVQLGEQLKNGRAGSELERRLRDALEKAGIERSLIEAAAATLRDAEDSKNEAAYDRQQERLMETGGGPILQEQQALAQKLK